jgi:hypothetical protein
LAALSHGDGATATPAQGDIVQRLIQRVDYDGSQGKLTIVLRQHDTTTPTELSA